MRKKQLIVIGGPTASGKTSLAIQLAKHFNTEIISADSRQLFKELNLGVARPTVEELQEAKHHLIASESIQQDFNAGVYAEKAQRLIDELFKTHDVLIMVGGTGLYIQAVLEGFDALPPADSALRKELNTIYKENGIQALQNELFKLDPKAQIKDLQNPQRIIRAIEILKGQTDQKSLNTGLNDKYLIHRFYIDHVRSVLYSRINDRVMQMLEDGLLDEAKKLFTFRNLNALQTVGYKELFQYLEGKYNLDFATDKIKQHTRNYAKRQITWFKNKGYHALPQNSNSAIDHIIELVDT